MRSAWWVYPRPCGETTEYSTAAGQREFRLRYLKLYRETGAGTRDTLAVATETPDGHVLWNFITTDRRGGFNRQRVGNLLYPKPR